MCDDTQLRHYLTITEETKARIIPCRYLLDRAGDLDSLTLAADCLRIVGVNDKEIRQAMDDPQCDGQEVLL